MDKPKLPPTNEILSAMASAELPNADIKKIADSAHDYLLSNYNFEMPESIEINVVENTENEVNLILPCYDTIDASYAQALNEGSLEDVKGGEIILGVILVSIFAVPAAGLVAVGGGLIGNAFAQDEAQRRRDAGEPAK